MIMKTLRYFYRPDHLGSTLWVTDSAKNGVQYCEYLPYGKPFIDQRSTTWSSRYTFSGKERDSETGYSYFGARFYHPDPSIWLSVDPMSDKYPNLTPYAYCANNPVILVDPDGREVYIIGEEAIAAFNELKKATKLTLTRDEKTGRIEVISGKARNKNDKLLLEAIESESIKVEITAQESNLFDDNGKKYKTELGGAFMGNCINWDEIGEVKSVETKQFISMERLKICFESKDVSKMILHELTESYMGGVISKERYEPADPAYAPKGGGISPNTIFREAHKLATRQPKNKPLYTLPKP
jgi:RHS repeat-associated protein